VPSESIVSFVLVLPNQPIYQQLLFKTSCGGTFLQTGCPTDRMAFLSFKALKDDSVPDWAQHAATIVPLSRVRNTVMVPCSLASSEHPSSDKDSVPDLETVSK